MPRTTRVQLQHPADEAARDAGRGGAAGSAREERGAPGSPSPREERLAGDLPEHAQQAHQAQDAQDAPARIEVEGLDAWFGSNHAVRGVSLRVPDRQVTAVIGPSGCGKSTFLRCLNRMHETVPGARVSGKVVLGTQDIYAPGVSPIAVRKRVGMVFQRPTPFPTMSIRDNVAAGLRVTGQRRSRSEVDEIVEHALVRAALWNETKDRLGSSAVALSGGQQQRLCIARALATNPEVLLLDEPTASLDPASTQRIEELVHDLRREVTIVIVTHNMQQAARVSDRTAFFLAGELIEHAATDVLFTTPADERTEAYITGRFG